MVLHTGSGVLQSVLLLHGWPMHVPTVPFVSVQYLPVEQLSTPASPTVRHPAVQTPVLVVDISQ